MGTHYFRNYFLATAYPDPSPAVLSLHANVVCLPVLGLGSLWLCHALQFDRQQQKYTAKWNSLNSLGVSQYDTLHVVIRIFHFQYSYVHEHSFSLKNQYRLFSFH